MHSFLYILSLCFVVAIMIPNDIAQQRDHLSSFYLACIIYIFAFTW